MAKQVLVAGGTGDLGVRVVEQLLNRNAKVRVVVRHSAESDKVTTLKSLGADVSIADTDSLPDLVKACKDCSCVVSTVAGLRDVIVDFQTRLMHAAETAGVSHFIPSDFSVDFTQIPAGQNRNFDLRREFYDIIDKSGMNATSIFNGAFADILEYSSPLFDSRQKVITYYDDRADWKIDFTTRDDTAAFTAEAALDEQAPRMLRIASFQVTPNELVDLSDQYKGEPFRLVNGGSLENLAANTKKQRAADPTGEMQLYPRWQQSQYLHSMYLVHHDHLDNDRYSGINWSEVADTLRER